MSYYVLSRQNFLCFIWTVVGILVTVFTAELSCIVWLKPNASAVSSYNFAFEFNEGLLPALSYYLGPLGNYFVYVYRLSHLGLGQTTGIQLAPRAQLDTQRSITCGLIACPMAGSR